MATQWLFIGGPADKKTAWIKAGRYVRWGAINGKECEYRAHDYVFNGRVYRVGALDLTDIQTDRVDALILSTGLNPIR